jgi:hypothetical protein
MKLVEQMEAVRTRDDFTAFVHAMLDDYSKNPDGWLNGNIEFYLESLTGWVTDMDGYFQGIGESVPEQPDWNLFARILFVARSYE